MIKQSVSIVSVPFGKGAGVSGAELGPRHILQASGLTRKLSELQISYKIA